MASTITLGSPSPPTERTAPDPEAYALEASLRALIGLGAATAPRSRQRAVGASEAGATCQRRFAYRAANVRPSNVPDPLPALVGTGVHHALAECFERLDAGSGRFLVETPVLYGGIPGTVDLYDRVTRTVIDWKTKPVAKVKRVRHDGPGTQYVAQVQLYAAGLAAMGESPQRVAIVYVPTDSTLDDLYVWQGPYEPDVARVVAERHSVTTADALASMSGRIDPATVAPTPGALCPWCPYYQPSSHNVSTSCPGKDSTS